MDLKYKNLEIDFEGQSAGSLLYFDGSDWVQLSPGDDGYILQTNGNSGPPMWIPMPTTSNVNIDGYVTSTFDGYSGLSYADYLVYFGDGSDGNVTISSGDTVTLSKDMHYKNLTVQGILISNGYRIFVSEILDLSSGGIHNNGNSGIYYGAAGVGLSAGTLGGSGAGSVGATTGIDENGSAAPSPSNITPANGGAGGAGGSGGNVTGGRPGASSTAGGTVSNSMSFHRWWPDMLRGDTLIMGGAGGAGGSSGGSDPGDSAAAGAGGGGGGGVIWISANTIYRTSSSNNGAIQALGGGSDYGGTHEAGNTGGGGGSGGGGGGFIYLSYLNLLGSVKTNFIDASGLGGNQGGLGWGNGIGGGGGQGGSGGRIITVNLANGTVAEAIGTTGSYGTAASGTAYGLGGAAGICRVDL